MIDNHPRKGDIVFGPHYSGLVLDHPISHRDGDTTLYVYVFFRLDVPGQTNTKTRWSFSNKNLPEIIRGEL